MPKKRGLGRGLESLISESVAEAGSTPDSRLALSEIKANPNQPRKNFDELALEDLADSIKKNGILQPILVRKKGAKYEIVAGERRYQAAKKAGLKEVPVFIREVSDQEILQLALIENLQRTDLNPIEEARCYKEIIDQQGITQEELGKALSKSRSAIANTLRLLDLPKIVQDQMEEGYLTAGHARAILAVPYPEAREKLAEKVVKERLTVRQTENLAPLFSGMEKPKTKREPNPQSFKRAASRLRISLETGVRVRKIRGKNKIEIEFKDEDDLVRILSLIDKDK